MKTGGWWMPQNEDGRMINFVSNFGSEGVGSCIREWKISGVVMLSWDKTLILCEWLLSTYVSKYEAENI